MKRKWRRRICAGDARWAVPAREKPEEASGRRTSSHKARLISQSLSALLGAARRAGTAHVVTLGPIGVARHLDDALPSLDEGDRPMAERERGGEGHQHGGLSVRFA